VDSSPTSCVLVLLIAIDVVVVVVPYAVSLPLLYKEGNRVDYNMIPIMTLSLLTYFTYVFIDIIICLGEHTMVLWNLLDSGPSLSGPLLGPSESMRGCTPGTNPRQIHIQKLHSAAPYLRLRVLGLRVDPEANTYSTI
jgi:hypothetical protein